MSYNCQLKIAYWKRKHPVLFFKFKDNVNYVQRSRAVGTERIPKNIYEKNNSKRGQKM